MTATEIQKPDVPQQMLTAAAAGARWLDKVAPEWVSQMPESRGELAMNSCVDCVIGHLTGDFFEGVREILPNLKSTMAGPGEKRIAAAGFNLSVKPPDPEMSDEEEKIYRKSWDRLYVLLGDAWWYEIEMRRNK